LIATLLVSSLKGKINERQIKDLLKDISSGGHALDIAYGKTMEIILSKQEEYRKLGILALLWVCPISP
jgi:hypothetical protein